MVYYGISGVWNPQVEQLIVDAVHEAGALTRTVNTRLMAGKP